MAAVEGAFLVAYNIVMAVTDVADAARAFAKQEYVQGALFVVSAAMHAAAAVEAGIRLGTSSAGANKAKAPAKGSKPENRHVPRAESPHEQRKTIININGPVTSRQVEDDLRRMEDGNSRRYDPAA
jgi:hypothetical protein